MKTILATGGFAAVTEAVRQAMPTTATERRQLAAQVNISEMELARFVHQGARFRVDRVEALAAVLIPGATVSLVLDGESAKVATA